MPGILYEFKKLISLKPTRHLNITLSSTCAIEKCISDEMAETANEEETGSVGSEHVTAGIE
jgi:hypothetical protein